MAERLPIIVRGKDCDAAVAEAKAWAKGEGLTLRTVASCKPREDITSWVADGVTVPPAFREEWQHAWEVVLVVADVTGPLPEPPTLWAGVAL